MKAIFITLICCSLLTLAHSQSHKKFLPFYKEKPQIDSLFESALKNDTSHGVFFSFATIKSGGKYLFSISQLKCKSEGVYYPFMQQIYMKNFGYFKFKNRIIFVSGEIDPYNFFSKTNTRKVFHFIWDKNNVYEDNDHLFFCLYDYEGGKFNVNIPELR